MSGWRSISEADTQQGLGETDRIYSNKIHLAATPIHAVGINWVDKFLDCNPGFKKAYIRYQEGT